MKKQEENNRSSGFILHSRFDEISCEFPQKTAIFTQEASWSYKDLYDTSKALSRFLYSQGVAKGDRVAIVLENRPQWPIAYFAILAAGATCVPIDTQSSVLEI